ncbi:hypothetical protein CAUPRSCDRAFT_10953 [Caulochytrium protostelioides]|nr:hypothetical protein CAUPRSCDRAFT_10953 [Caulochytrium protostelioides]
MLLETTMLLPAPPWPPLVTIAGHPAPRRLTARPPPPPAPLEEADIADLLARLGVLSSAEGSPGKEAHAIVTAWYQQQQQQRCQQPHQNREDEEAPAPASTP